MCALQPPFNAQSLHQLATKIIQGKYAAVPSHFSQSIPNLLEAMLNKDPNKRPNINQILKYPIIAERIKKLLNEEDFKDEFSHTILHNQNVFDEFKAIQARKKDDAEKKQKEAAAAEEEKKRMEDINTKMLNVNLNEYKPKYGQDQELFNAMYMNYIQGLSNPNAEMPNPPQMNPRV